MQFRDVVAPFSIRLARKYLSRSDVRILDVGCGTYSPIAVRGVFPQAIYHAIDKVEPLGNLRSLMNSFFRLDLTKNNFDVIPDDFYDAIILSHIIEHLSNGDEVVTAMAGKLRPGGFMIVEFPGPRAIGLPSGVGTLQFCDDETHVRVFDVREVANAMLRGGLKVVDGGTRRDPWRIIFSPLAIPLQIKTLITKRKLNARGLWDILGFAEFVVGVRRA